MSFRYAAGINKPGYNPLATPTYTYNLLTWGRGTAGDLGLGNTTSYSSPVQVGLLTNWSKINGGKNFTTAVKTDGTLWAWGDGAAGKLGFGNTTSYSSPKQVGALTTWLSTASAYSNYTLAIKTDGTLWSWGQGFGGQLGLGDTASRSSPTQVGALTTWLNTACGQYASYAIKTDGTLWSWGSNIFGGLGLGNTTYYSSPVQVGALTNWLNVTAGQYFATAIKTDGTLWTWGYGNNGRLGTGNSVNKSSPVQVGALTNWLSVATGYRSTLSIKTDGTLWGWGFNDVGQLGLGNITGYSSPVQVGSTITWSKISGNGQSYFLITKTDGTLWSCGSNAFGQLGLGDTTNRSSLTQVGNTTTWRTIAAGSYHAIAIG